MLRLTQILGCPVAVGERRLGRVRDLEVAPGEDHPCVVAIQVRSLRASPRRIRWGEATRWEDGRVICDSDEPATVERALPLRAGVLDDQVIDLAGKRVVRVGDVLLAESSPGPRLVGVEIGLDPVLRRLGLGWLRRPAEPQVLDWRDLHLLSRHELKLGTARSQVHRLTPEELAGLIAGLPRPKAERLLEVAPPEHATAARDALALAPRRPRFGRTLRARRRAPR